MKYDELKVSVSFSVPRKLMAGVRTRARRLGMPMSTYISLLIRNDLVRGLDAPLHFNSGELAELDSSPEPRTGVLVDLQP